MPPGTESGNFYPFKVSNDWTKTRSFVVKSGLLNGSSPPAPLVYQALRLIDPKQIVPGVQPGVGGDTMPYGSLHYTFYRNVMKALDTSSFQSVTYRLHYPSGDPICTVLVNSQGIWTSGLDYYSIFAGELSTVSATPLGHTETWPSLNQPEKEFFLSREVTAKLASHERENLDKAEMWASLAAGALEGVGKGMGGIVDYRRKRDLLQLSNDLAKERMELHGKLQAAQTVATIEGQNWINEQSYERKVGKQETIDDSVSAHNRAQHGQTIDYTIPDYEIDVDEYGEADSEEPIAHPKTAINHHVQQPDDDTALVEGMLPGLHTATGFPKPNDQNTSWERRAQRAMTSDKNDSSWNKRMASAMGKTTHIVE
jgi:hypothetical protein